jgi:DNA-binding response OmpR family regulator
MKILILEDDTYRATFFIERFCNYDISITEKADMAIEYLENNVFDYVFLDHDLGEHNGCGADVAAYLSNNIENPNNNAVIIIHSWNMPAASAMKNKLPKSIIAPFNSAVFLSLDLDK